MMTIVGEGSGDTTHNDGDGSSKKLGSTARGEVHGAKGGWGKEVRTLESIYRDGNINNGGGMRSTLMLVTACSIGNLEYVHR